MRRANYETSRNENVETMICIGSKSAIIRDPKSAGEIDKGSHLRLWRGDSEADLWLDRSDARNELEGPHLKQFSAAVPSSSSTPGHCEYMLDDDEASYFEDLVMERYQDLLDFKEENLQFDLPSTVEHDLDVDEILLNKSEPQIDSAVAQPFSWGYQSNRTEHWVRPEREPYPVPAVWDIKDNIKLPMTKKQFDVIVHTVKNIRMKGPQFEIFLKLKQSDDNPLFDFLNCECDLNGLFEKMKSIPTDVFQAGLEMLVEQQTVRKEDQETLQIRGINDGCEDITPAPTMVMNTMAAADDVDRVAATVTATATKAVIVEVVEDVTNALSLLGNMYGDGSCSDGDGDDDNLLREGGEVGCCQDADHISVVKSGVVAGEEGGSKGLLSRSVTHLNRNDSNDTTSETYANNRDEDKHKNEEEEMTSEDDDAETASTASFVNNDETLSRSGQCLFGEVAVSRDTSSMNLPDFATQELETCELEEEVEVVEEEEAGEEVDAVEGEGEEEKEVEDLLLLLSPGNCESDGEYIATQDFSEEHSKSQESQVEDSKEGEILLDGSSEKSYSATAVMSFTLESAPLTPLFERDPAGIVGIDSEEVFRNGHPTSIESSQCTDNSATIVLRQGYLDCANTSQQGQVEGEYLLATEHGKETTEGTEERNTVFKGSYEKEEGEVESVEDVQDVLKTSDTLEKGVEFTSTTPSITLNRAVELNSDLNSTDLRANISQSVELESEPSDQGEQGDLDLSDNEPSELGELVACKADKHPTCLELKDRLRLLEEEKLGLADIEDDMLDDDVDAYNFWGTAHQLKVKSEARLGEIHSEKEDIIKMMTDLEASAALQKKRADRLKRAKLLKEQFQEKAAAAYREAEQLKVDSAVYDVLAAVPILENGPGPSSNTSSSDDSDDSSCSRQGAKVQKRRERTRTRSRSRSADSRYTDAHRSRERRHRTRNTHSDRSRKSTVIDRSRDRGKSRDEGKHRKRSFDDDRGNDEEKVGSKRSYTSKEKSSGKEKDRRKEEEVHRHKHRHRSRERSRIRDRVRSRDKRKETHSSKDRDKGKEDVIRGEATRGRKRHLASSPSTSSSPSPSPSPFSSSSSSSSHQSSRNKIRKASTQESSLSSSLISSSSSVLDFKDKIRVALGVGPLKPAHLHVSTAVPFRDKIQLALDSMKG